MGWPDLSLVACPTHDLTIEEYISRIDRTNDRTNAAELTRNNRHWTLTHMSPETDWITPLYHNTLLTVCTANLTWTSSLYIASPAPPVSSRPIAWGRFHSRVRNVQYVDKWGPLGFTGRGRVNKYFSGFLCYDFTHKTTSSIAICPTNRL